MAGDQEWAEPVEILGADEATTEIEGGRTVDWHQVLRTGAAVVIAASLLWTGRSYADQADAEQRTTCINDVQSAFYRYEQYGYQAGDGSASGGLRIDSDVVDELVARAEACGAGAFAESLDRTRPEPEDDD